MTGSGVALVDLWKSFGKTEIIRGLSLRVEQGERHALIGPNGAGKSTLFHLISGQMRPTSGEIYLGQTKISGRTAQDINRMGLSRSFQITNIFPKLTVIENVTLGVMRCFGIQYNFWTSMSKLRAVRRKADELLESVRLTDRRTSLAGALTYSEQRALELGITLASDPSVLLLDEPMAGMSREETEYTVSLLQQLTKGRTLMIVEHDMDVVFSISDRISVLVYGQIVATGTPEQVRANASVQEAYLGTGEAA